MIRVILNIKQSQNSEKTIVTFMILASPRSNGITYVMKKDKI